MLEWQDSREIQKMNKPQLAQLKLMWTLIWSCWCVSFSDTSATTMVNDIQLPSSQVHFLFSLADLWKAWLGENMPFLWSQLHDPLPDCYFLITPGFIGDWFRHVFVGSALMPFVFRACRIERPHGSLCDLEDLYIIEPFIRFFVLGIIISKLVRMFISWRSQ